MKCPRCGHEVCSLAVVCEHCNQDLSDTSQNQASQIHEREPTYLLLAVFSTLCCCLPVGLFAIYYAAKSKAYYDAGKYQEGADCATNAQVLSWVSIIIGALLLALYYSSGRY